MLILISNVLVNETELLLIFESRYLHINMITCVFFIVDVFFLNIFLMHLFIYLYFTCNLKKTKSNEYVQICIEKK